jgi:hypothetical protein
MSGMLFGDLTKVMYLQTLWIAVCPRCEYSPCSSNTVGTEFLGREGARAYKDKSYRMQKQGFLEVKNKVGGTLFISRLSYTKPWQRRLYKESEPSSRRELHTYVALTGTVY